jgi:hypothetical protein
MAQANLSAVSPSGTLTYNVTSGPISPCGPEGQFSYQQYTYSSFVYQNNGNYAIPGSLVYYNSPGSSQGCPPSGIPSLPISLDASTYGSGCTITINSQEGGTYYTQTLTCPTITTATYDPLYKVISILYSPPGNDSYNGFTDTTSIATNTTVGSNFTASRSITFTEGFGNCTLECASVSESFGASQSSLSSSAFADTFGDATSLTNSPLSTASNVINHSMDMIVTWLDPQVTVTGNGSTPQSYSVNVAPTANGATPDPDIIWLTANVMEAQPGTVSTANPYGQSAVPYFWLNQQQDRVTGQNVPGMAGICANLNVAEYDNLSCTTADQCGCNPNDFAPLLAQDPLVNASGNTSPLTVDTSQNCGTLPTPSGADCRFVPVPEQPGSTTQEVETMSGPDSPGGNTGCSGFTQYENQSATQTLGSADAYSVGVSVKAGSFGFSTTKSGQWQWSQSKSTGTTSGQGVSQGVKMCSYTVGCGAQIPIYEDTVYHTFAFMGGSPSCP